LAFTALFAFIYLSARFIARHFGREFTGLGCKAVYVAPLLPHLLCMDEMAYLSYDDNAHI
jgi:hypothetical protein